MNTVAFCFLLHPFLWGSRVRDVEESGMKFSLRYTAEMHFLRWSATTSDIYEHRKWRWEVSQLQELGFCFWLLSLGVYTFVCSCTEVIVYKNSKWAVFFFYWAKCTQRDFISLVLTKMENEPGRLFLYLRGTRQGCTPQWVMDYSEHCLYQMSHGFLSK